MKTTPTQTKIDTAIALAKQASDTATALASAKAQSDIVAAVVGKDISVIKSDILEIKADIKTIITGTVSKTEHSEVCSSIKDHEDRIRNVETKTTKIMSYGVALIFIVGIIEFVLQIYFRTH